MTSCERATVSLSGPAELIQAVPYLLGFHPEESLVAVGFRRPGGSALTAKASQLAVAARCDLAPDAPYGLDQAAIEELVHVLARAGCDGLALLIFSDRDDAEAPWTRPAEVHAALASVPLLDSAVMPLLDLLLVCRSRWRSALCQDPRCCPAEGAARSDGLATAAELTYAGLVAHPDRASLLAGLTGRPEPARAKLMPALHRAEQRLTTLLQSQVPERVRRSELAATTRAGLDCELGEVLSNRRITRLGVALRDTAIRDEVWLAVDSRTVSLGQLLHQLHSALPAPYDAAPMFLYGWDRWRSGSGTLACEAADRALRSDPGYSAARLLIEAVQSGLDPHSTPCLRKPGG